MTNPYGDLELDARGMRALAHPVRVRILAELQRHGPSTATRLSPAVGATPSVTSWHLRHLAEHGLVRDAEHEGSGRERWWAASTRGFRYERQGPAEAEAARQLTRVIEEAEGDVVGEWHRDVEPHLPPEWAAVAGRSSTRVLVTPEEAHALEAAIEDLLAPYVLRKDEPGAPPDDARTVLLLRHTMPDPADDDLDDDTGPDAHRGGPGDD